jgi:uncharacterized membrane protein
MLPDPLHPAVVHFPIVLAFLLPIAALAAVWHGRRRPGSRGPWILTLALAAALTASAWLAVQTGGREEETVERVVPEAPLENHEEAAERFLLLSAGVLLVAGAGLLRGRIGVAARLATTVGALGLVVAGALVGHSGGKLVYQYGAAAAHAPGDRGTGMATRASQPEQADEQSPDD